MWCKGQPKQAGAVIVKALTAVLPDVKLPHLTKTLSMSGRCVFDVACALLNNLSDMFFASDNALKTLIPILSTSYGSFAGAENAKLKSAADRSFTEAIKNDQKKIEKCIKVLLTIDLSIWDITFLGYLVRKAHLSGNGTFTVAALQKYVDLFFMTKNAIHSHLIVSSSALNSVTSHENFSQILLPGIRKSALRTPELAVNAIAACISCLTIDLSRYVTDLLENFSPLMASTNSVVHEGAEKCFEVMYTKVSDSGAAKSIIDCVFEVLEGSKGKIASYKQREMIVMLIQKFKKVSITGNSAIEGLALHVIQRLQKFLKTETNDSVTFRSVLCFGSWGMWLKTDIPVNVTNTFKESLANGSSALVRIHYHIAADMIFREDAVIILENLESTLMLIVEKTSVNTVLSVVEGIFAASLLLKLARNDLGVVDDIYTAMKDKLLTNDILSILNTKVIPSCNNFNSMLLVNYLKETLLQLNTNSDTKRSLMKSLLSVLFNLDHHAQNAVLKALNDVFLHDPELSIPLALGYLKTEVKNYSNTEDLPHNSVKFVKNVESIFKVIAVLPQVTKEEAYFESLLFCNDPCLSPYNSKLSLKLAHICSINLFTFGKEYADRLIALVQDNASEECYVMVRTLSDHSLTLITPLINVCLTSFQAGAIKTVTLDDMEIHSTPKGTLWLTSMLDEFEKSQVVDKNIKRESKLYSFEDQKWEQEMRAKLQKEKGMKLTKKQQDDLNHRLQREDEIRQHVENLRKNFIHKYNILMSLLDVKLEHLMYSISRICSSIISMLSYPLTASKSINLLIKLMLKVFPKTFENLGHLLGRVTVRLYDPPCEICSEWLVEPMKLAFGRCIGRFEQMLATGYTLPSAVFSVVFPFLSYIVSSSDMTSEEYETNAVIALNVILGQVKKRATAQNQFDGPKFMPLKDLMNMCCSTFEKKPVSLVGKMLLDVLKESCLAASSNPGCAVAAEDEISALVSYLTSENDELRMHILKNLLLLKLPLATFVRDNIDITSLPNKLTTLVWICKHDASSAVKEAAIELWDDPFCQFEEFISMCDGIIQYSLLPKRHVQAAASKALKVLLETLDNLTDYVLQSLITLFNERLDMPKPVKDDIGRVIIEAPPDKWEERLGISYALYEIVPFLINDQILALINLIVPTGLLDNSVDVQVKMREVGEAIIDHHGQLVIDVLLPVFEDYLDNTPNARATDVAKQNVVILMAFLAKHLSNDDPKVKPIVCKLMEALSTPSEQVQTAVAKCLVPLVPAIKDLAPALVKRILYQLIESENYGERRGASYGLAGFVKGLGLLSLKKLNIMPFLIEAINNKKEFKHREGALMAFEQLSSMMGHLFEPYVISVLPHLLVCFGDSNQYVREATDKASKAIMGKLSGHGVKLVLPSLLKALAEDSWRTKCGSVDLLGAMAYCNPKQLSSCLPSIVPKLIEVMADSHTKVQRAGQQALKQIGSVIKNPEIQNIVESLLDALSEPSKYTDKCLTILLKTSFVHRIDAPSLALIIPVLTRSFDQRTDTKKSAAQIVGNILELTDEKDLKPYLDSIIPGLKSALLDPVPDVRLYSAKALGCLVRGIGEIPLLMDWLLETLISEQSSVDRSGAAQGVSEVMVGLGPHRLGTLMESVLESLGDETISASERDGYLMLFIYFPISMKNDFAFYIDQILDPILSGLASESEYVRETSYKAGQKIVQIYADSAINLFLPRLEKGLFNENHRIRHASCCLLGDLLYKIMGVSGKQSTVSANEDDNFGTDETKKIIIDVLGVETRNRVFAGLYMARSDVALNVRQASLHIWKIVVSNTPKTLKEILSVLIEMILSCLASEADDKQAVAKKTLADLVKKLGDRILPEVIPILERSLQTDNETHRRGVCLGLSEIIDATSKDQVEIYSDNLLPAIRKVLIDHHAEVRSSAASTFAALHNVLGSRALDEILSPLLELMETLEGEQADNLIDALKVIMTAKSNVVLPYMVPKLVQKPVNIAALASLSSVANNALYAHLDLIIRSVVQGLCELGEDAASTEIDHGKAIVASIKELDGHEVIFETLSQLIVNENDHTRMYSAQLLNSFCKNEHVDMDEFIKDLWKVLLGRFSDYNEDIVKICWESFNVATKNLLSGDQVRLVPDLRTAVSMAVDMKNKRDPTYTLPGFCLPKGIHVIVGLYREGILNGTLELKEHSILGIKEAVQLTSPISLKPSVVQITGPLIRVLGERYSSNIKVACLDALSLLIDKVKIALKPFLSQLQTTFVKSLIDTSKDVRCKGVVALTKLITFHNKVDNLFNDLHAGTSHPDLNIRETMFSALHGTMLYAGSSMSSTLARAITVTLGTNIGAAEESIRVANGACIGSLTTFLDEDQLLRFLNDNILNGSATDWTIKHGRALALAGMYTFSPDRILKLNLTSITVNAIIKYMESDKVPVCNSGCYASAKAVTYLLQSGETGEHFDRLIDSLVRNCSNNNSNDVRSFANNMVHMINISGIDVLPEPVIIKFIIPLLESTTKKVPAVRSSSEVAIATLLRLKSNTDIHESIKGKLDSKSLDTLTRFLPTAIRVAGDYKTHSTYEDNVFNNFSHK